MNHVIYADDICLLAPSAIGLQQMLDVYLNFSICNDIIRIDIIRIDSKCKQHTFTE